MDSILPEANYNDVRAAIDVTLTANDLPDSTIGADVYRGAAEDDVLNRVSDAASKTGNDLKRVQRAAVMFCAARLIPAVVQITSLSTTVRDMSISRPAWNAENRAAELRKAANQQLDEISNVDTAVPVLKQAKFKTYRIDTA